MMHGLWKVISKQTWWDNQDHFLKYFNNSWNKIYGKKHIENGSTNYSNSSGVNWEYLYHERSKGNFCNIQHYRNE